MGRIIGPEPGIPWQEKIEREAGNLGRASFENFKHCSNLCLELCPDKLDSAQRAEVFNTCAMAFIGGLVNTLATFGNYTPEFEEIVISETRARFKFIREHEAKLLNERMSEAQKNRIAKGNLRVEKD